MTMETKFLRADDGFWACTASKDSAQRKPAIGLCYFPERS